MAIDSAVKVGWSLPGGKGKRVNMREIEEFRVAVAGTGYVGAVHRHLLAQHHTVTAVDIIPEKI